MVRISAGPVQLQRHWLFIYWTRADPLV